MSPASCCSPHCVWHSSVALSTKLYQGYLIFKLSAEELTCDHDLLAPAP